MSPRQPDRATAPPDVVVDFTVDDGLEAGWDQPRIRQLVQEIVQRHFSSAGSFVVGLHLVDDRTIRRLNAAHRGKDARTDVLSFPLQDDDGARFVVPPAEPSHLGDVVVSWPRAERQAREYGHSLEREIAYLVAHGLLHILGYDHEQAGDRSCMRQQEEEALRPLGFTR